MNRWTRKTATLIILTLICITLFANSNLSLFAAAPSWEGWQRVQGQTQGRPWLAPEGEQIIAAHQGMDSKLYITNMIHGEIGDWRKNNLTCSSGPAVVNFNGRKQAFIRNGDGRLYTTLANNPTRRNDDFYGGFWQDAQSRIASEPAAVVFNNRVYVVIRGVDNQLMINSIDERGRWGNWKRLNFVSNSSPFIGLYQGRLYVAARDRNNQILLNSDPLGSGSWKEIPGDGRSNDTPVFAEYRNQLYVVVRGTDNGIWVNVKRNNDWSGWTEIGGATLAAPAIAATNSQLQLMVRGTDNNLYINQLTRFSSWEPRPIPQPHQPQPRSQWSGWNRYPDGQTTSGPAVAEYNGQIVTMVRGTDNQIYLKTGLSSGWTNIGGETIGSPVLENHRGSLYALVRGTDDGIYLNRFSGSWQGWSNIGGTTASGGTLVSFEGSLYAIVRGTDNGIYVNRMNDRGNWNRWTNIGGITAGEPAATVYRGRLYLAVRGTDDKVYIRSMAGNSWDKWTEVYGDGRTPSGPCLVNFQNQLWIVARGADNRIYANVRSENGRFDGWSQLPGNGLTGSNPSALVYRDRLYVMVQGTDKSVYWNEYR